MNYSSYLYTTDESEGENEELAYESDRAGVELNALSQSESGGEEF